MLKGFYIFIEIITWFNVSLIEFTLKCEIQWMILYTDGNLSKQFLSDQIRNVSSNLSDSFLKKLIKK